MRESASGGIICGLEEATGSDVAARAGVALGSGQEVLGTDMRPGDSRGVCGAGAAAVVQEGGRAARRRRGLQSCGAFNVPFMQSWDRGPFRDGLAPLGSLPHSRSRTLYPLLPWWSPAAQSPPPRANSTPSASVIVLHPTLSLLQPCLPGRLCL